MLRHGDEQADALENDPRNNPCSGVNGSTTRQISSLLLSNSVTLFYTSSDT